MENQTELQKKYNDLKTLEGFEKYFWSLHWYFKTYEETFEAANEFYRGIFGKDRYSSYDSFREVRDRKTRKIKNDEKIINPIIDNNTNKLQERKSKAVVKKRKPSPVKSNKLKKGI